MHTMTCSHHSTPFLNDFKLYPSSFHHPKTQRYTHFHLSPNEHILIFLFQPTRDSFFFIHSALFFSFSFHVFFFFYSIGDSIYKNKSFFFFYLQWLSFFLSFFLVHFFSLSLTSQSKDQKNLSSQTQQPSQRLA